MKKALLTEAQAARLAKLRKPKRQLTHQLEYNQRSGLWSCKCGYVLGTGHDALYAPCSLNQKRYIETDITAQPKSHQPVSKAALDLFDI